MSGLDVAAAVVGITEFSIHNIVSLYKFVKDLKGVPDLVQDVQREISALERVLRGLNFLKAAPSDVQNSIKSIGVAETVKTCDDSCLELRDKLNRWTKNGTEVHSLPVKLKIRSQRAEIEEYLAHIRTARETVNLAVVIANLQISISKKTGSADETQKAVQSVKSEILKIGEGAKANRARVEGMESNLMALLKADEDDRELQSAVEKTVGEKRAWTQLWTNCKFALNQIQTVQVKQRIGKVTTGENTKLNVGMPTSVIERVEEQIIGDVTIGKGSTVNIGIF